MATQGGNAASVTPGTEVALDGRVAIVTGGAGGIGRAYCAALARAGATVVVADISAAGARSVADDLVERGLQAMGIELDVVSQDSIDLMVERVVAKFGRIDILVNNAALMSEIPTPRVSDLPMEWWDRVIATNLTGPLMLVRTVVPHMRRLGYGKVINQVSGGAFLPAGAYGVSKLGLVSLTVSLAHELGAWGIRVNAMAPGYVETEAVKKVANDAYRQFIEQTVPLPFGKPSDLQGGLLFLASSASDWMTGQTLHIDGGWISRL